MKKRAYLTHPTEAWSMCRRACPRCHRHRAAEYARAPESGRSASECRCASTSRGTQAHQLAECKLRCPRTCRLACPDGSQGAPEGCAQRLPLGLRSMQLRTLPLQSRAPRLAGACSSS
eukprot:123222-Rhodomonas_salina.1